MRRYRVGIIGATGMVGQRFVRLLAEHPWFDIALVAASPRSAGKTYEEAVAGRWAFDCPIPAGVRALRMGDAYDVAGVARAVDFVFCAIALDKAQTRALEESYAAAGLPVVSNNSACRLLPDVPMLIPEINHDHARVIAAQRKRLGTDSGFIVVKPNCSIQSYVPALTPLLGFGVEKVAVCTYQAISGAGKTFATWPEMADNVIPYIGGEEEKSEREPLKIWGAMDAAGEAVVLAEKPVISAQCVRVPVSDGHLAAVRVSLREKPSPEDIIARWRGWVTLPQQWGLPSAPAPFLQYLDEPDRPQTRLDRDYQGGMGVTIGRLAADSLFDYRFVCLSHNTLRGAAGGGVLSAEYLCQAGYIRAK